MRILWVCNIVLPIIAKELGMPASNKEGWLSGLCGRLLNGMGAEDNERAAEAGVTPEDGGSSAEERSGAEIVLGVCFPVNGMPDGAAGVKGRLRGKELYYYGFSEDTVHEERYDAALEQRIREIIEDFQPDILHCFGAEYGHTYAAVKAFERPQRTLIGIQGVCAACAEHYLDGVPEKVARRKTLRDLLRKDNLLQQKEKMRKRGEREARALALAGHVTGRTLFDRSETEKAAPQADYHVMNETMRAAFYDGCWTYEDCEKHSVFVSQGNYPVKGLHYVLRALRILKKQYPDIRLYVAGDCIVRRGSTGWMNRLKISSYGAYLESLIREGGLEEQVFFLGQMDAEQMKAQYLKAHVFLSASTIENSPNSVGEAMLLGVPVVSSLVGGVPDLVTDEKEGLLYHADNVSALAMAVARIFEDRELADRLSAAARVRARKTHDADTNYRRLLEIYQEINHENNLCQ
ncbi:MAG: glycosyltransferase family 4 protein [Lachnospiraceae bacterium]|nr:glycosyltransferase family 4 protein [Lachnospiraceae bacterium]